MILVDTHVLIDVLEDDPQWAEWSVAQLRAHSKIHELGINAIVYAELSLAFERLEELDDAVMRLGLRLLEIPRPALFLAGRAFLTYRKAGGPRSNVLADFFIGAHAAVAGVAILTRDARRYTTYFPAVKLLLPVTP
jgi:predicted nucleic acid-binding protein